MRNFSMLIDGQLVPGATTNDVINPATGEVAAAAPCADEAQLEAAIAAARRAFPTWAARLPAERGQMLRAVADGIETRLEELARILTTEQGKPLAEATAEIGGGAAIIRMLSAMELPETVLKETDTLKVLKHHTPHGVVAVITPWNFPFLIMAIKTASALMAGNTVIAKPAPTTPLSSLVFGEICAEHLPAGVFNIIADRNDLGGKLTSHPDVAKITFTGSTATGKKIMAAAATTLKRITLELGGNDAAIVLDDVDPKDVAAKLFAGAMINAGQVCVAIKRVYAPDAIYDALCDELAVLAEAAVVGDGLQQGSQIGPIQNRGQYEKIKELIRDAAGQGKVIAGGGEVGGGGFLHPSDDRARPS